MRRFAVFASLFLILLATFTTSRILSRRHEARIEAHLDALTDARDSLEQADIGLSDIAAHTLRFKKHRDALVDLGHFRSRVFKLRNIAMDSLQANRLVDEIRVRFVGKSLSSSSLDDNDPTVASTLTVWDQKERLAEWAVVVAAHDDPHNPLLASDRVPSTVQVEDLVGTWMDVNGKPTYLIEKNQDGGLRLKSFAAQNWNKVIKHLRFEDGALAFDQFHYLSPEARSRLEVETDNAFEGVRCMIKLKRDETDPNILLQYLDTIHLQEPTESRLARGESDG